MRVVRTIVAVIFAATIAVTGCTHTNTDQPRAGTREDLLRALDDARSLADQWAERTRVEVDHWTDLDPHGKTERGIELMQAAIQRQPSAPGRPTTKPNDLPQAP
jgi:hypothetical protein